MGTEMIDEKCGVFYQVGFGCEDRGVGKTVREWIFGTFEFVTFCVHLTNGFK